jgi:hypothetical protein
MTCTNASRGPRCGMSCGIIVFWTLGIHGSRTVCTAGEANAAKAKGEGAKGVVTYPGWRVERATRPKDKGGFHAKGAGPEAGTEEGERGQHSLLPRLLSSSTWLKT